MEVEVKLRLPDKEAHDRVASLLQSSRQAVHHQENYFFDGKEKELSRERAVLRLRFYDQDKKATLTLKVRLPVRLSAPVAAETFPVAPHRRASQ